MSKNSSTRTITYSERATYSNYGTQKVRLGKDSQHQFDQCNICLHALVEPMSCHKGHLFCKKCIYESLLNQKKDNKKKMKLWQESEKLNAQLILSQKQKEEQAKIEEFAKQESSIMRTRDAIPTKEAEKPKLTKSFWMPEESPVASVSTQAKPSKDTHCPRDGHTLRLKDLVEMQFATVKQRAHAKDDEDLTAPEFGQYICPTCRKDLHAVSKVVMMKNCGHALCSKCADQFVEKKCPICEKPCDGPKEIVTLQAGASAFAEGGATVATKDTPAARIM